MHKKPWTVVLLSACWALFSCARSMPVEQRIAVHEAEIRTATIDEIKLPILLGIYPEASLPSVLHNLTPGAEEGLVYWEWTEFPGEGGQKLVKTAYGKLSPEGAEFPFAKELDCSKIYTGIGIRLTFLYKKPTGEWIQRLMLPGMLPSKASRPAKERLKLKKMGALLHADENIQLIDAERIPATQRAAVIADVFEMILLP
jgi:hypothetical protein